MSDTKLKVVPIRVDLQTYKDLRKLAYLTEQPMAEIIRNGIEYQLNNYKKVLTNSDIAV